MQALVIDRLGGPKVYRVTEMPIPEPGLGQVQIRVEGAGMNPVDWKIREGLYRPNDFVDFPAITLREFSGRVTKLGPEVTSCCVGDAVYGITDMGAAAEYTVAPEASIGPRPRLLEPAQCAIVPLAGMTAWQALFDHGHLRPKQRVLIHAASGGVGTYAVQLAKWHDAHVIGTASRDHKEAVMDLGADEVVDYRSRPFEEVVHGVDLVLHSIGQDQLMSSLKCLKPGGRLVAISCDPMTEEARQQDKTSLRFTMQPNTGQLRKLAELIDQQEVRPVIQRMVSLSHVPEAMRDLQRGHTLGKMGVMVT
jgi:NADPH:quinone reductase-like Zn-dependent oxidoreductase